MHKYQKSCSQLIWPFYGLLELYEQNSYLRQFCAQVSKDVFLADLTVLRIITTVWAKMSQKSYLREFCAQVSQNVFLADLTIFTAYYYFMSRNVKKFISPRVLCTSITDRVSSCFYGSLELYEQKCHKVISLRVLCTSIKNRVPSWFDRSMACYNCMSKNATKLISPRVLCTSSTNCVLSWFDRFTAYYYCIYKNVTKTHIFASFVHKYKNSCS